MNILARLALHIDQIAMEAEKHHGYLQKTLYGAPEADSRPYADRLARLTDPVDLPQDDSMSYIAVEDVSRRRMAR